jgi:hypothetical protein
LSRKPIATEDDFENVLREIFAEFQRAAADCLSQQFLIRQIRGSIRHRFRVSEARGRRIWLEAIQALERMENAGTVRRFRVLFSAPGDVRMVYQLVDSPPTEQESVAPDDNEEEMLPTDDLIDTPLIHPHPEPEQNQEAS